MPIRIEHSPLRSITIYCLFLFVILPLAPFDLAAQMNLAWDRETDFSVIGYKVYYGTASRTYGVPINVGNVTTYTLNGLTQGLTYYIAVTAYNAANYESGYSNEVSITITETVGIPNVLSGPVNGIVGTAYSYTAGGSTSTLGKPVEYQFDWKGDGSDLSPWGSETQTKTWSTAGIYNVKAMARSAPNISVMSGWSNPLTVSITRFTDVPFGNWAYDFIMAIHDAGITGGCSANPPLFCPNNTITRGQMAVFMEASLGVKVVPPCTGTVFNDVNAATVGPAFCGFIEDFATRGITGGCGGGNYCPSAPVTRWQMAVFIEAALGRVPGHLPPTCSGTFNDVNASTVGDYVCRMIEDFALQGITGGCGGGNFCPSSPVTRAQMGVFLVAAPQPLNP